jgi:DNA-binding NarL/FixJ family response regulator
MHLRRSGDSFV